MSLDPNRSLEDCCYLVSGNSKSGNNGLGGILIEASTNHHHPEHDVDDSDARKMQPAADHTGALDRSGPVLLQPFRKSRADE